MIDKDSLKIKELEHVLIEKVEQPELVRKGPDLAVDGVIRWRLVDLARVRH